MSTFERRLPYFIILLAVIAGIAGFWVSKTMFVPSQPSGAFKQLRGTLLYPTPRELPAFSLTRADGARVDAGQWTGSWRLVFLGFTTCPDVCPTTLGTLKSAIAEARRQAPQARFDVSFVSVDPERDTLEKLGAYVGFFSPEFEAVTGEKAALDVLVRGFSAIYEKVPTGSGPFDYTIDHTASIFVISPDGKLVGLMRAPHDARAIAADLVDLAKGI